MEERIPDELKILNFRNFPEGEPHSNQILEGVNQMLSAKGVMLEESTILNATIITVPSSTTNKPKVRDSELHSVAKGDRHQGDGPKNQEVQSR